MRKPEPWYMKRRGGWFVQINKKQVLLGKAPETKNPPPDILREYHRIMSGHGLLDAQDRIRATTNEIIEAFLEIKSSQRKKTVAKYVIFMSDFAKALGRKKLAAIRPGDVTSWIESHPGWGGGTKHGVFQIIQTFFRWSRDAGYLEFNPMAGYPNTYPRGRRERGLTLEEFDTLMDATDADFRRVLRVLRDTGCRPGELCVITASHLHPTDPCAILQPHEHKTGGRTGRKRVIVLPGALNKEFRELARQRPVGPLLLSSRTRVPWKTQNIQQRFARLRKKTGLPKEVVPYAARHSFVTRLITLGVPSSVAAKIAGHSNDSITLSTYTHLEMSDMTRAVDEAEGVVTKP